ncbi:MAG: hypothetical protein ACI9TK_000837 [Flavobacteriaceae bacterium]|jgi:hypothetical protein|tara:strand:- start:9231 stop:10568 length:1338 start_codon:yes stop_codon:yes gene_type:complete
MQNHLTLLLLILLVGCSPTTETNWPYLSSVNGVWESVNTFGGSLEDVAHGVITTSDGGFVVVGNTQSTDGIFINKTRVGSDLFIMKFNANAQQQWVQTYGGSNDDRGYDIVEMEKGYAIIGYSKSFDGDASLNKGQHDSWLLRIDTEGTLLWEKSFGFLGHDHAYNIISTQDGGLFFNGFLDVTASEGAGRDGIKPNKNQKHGVGEFWCHKLDSNGILQWRRYFGGTSNDRSYDAIETRDGNFVLVGSSESQDVDVSDPHGSYDAWIVKINSEGTLLWERSIGGSAYDIANAIIENRKGEYLILGQSFSQDGDIDKPLGSSDMFLSILSSSGELKSNKNIGDSGFDTGNALVERLDGTLILVGHTAPETLAAGENLLSNNVLIAHTLPNGSVINQYTLNGDGLDLAHGVALRASGKILVVGSNESSSGDFPASKGGKDFFVAVWH